MKNQTDMFAATGEAQSVPPYLDPEVVGAVYCVPARDRDHVSEATVGRFGNDAHCCVVEVWDKAGEVIHAESFYGETRERDAGRRSKDILETIARNRQLALTLS